MTQFMQQLIAYLARCTAIEAAIFSLVENIVIFLLAVGIGHLLMRTFDRRRVTPAPQQTERAEIVLVISTLIFNSLITFLGWWLWRIGIIEFRTDTGLRAFVVDTVVLLVVMDLAMYGLHRVAHWRFLFPLLHRTHHHYDRPHPLTLFVLNPAEALSFGLLWLVVITIYDASWIGMSIYLMVNVLFGMMGHLGVEPLPDRWKQIPLLRLLTTSTFHAQHHNDREHNFGFYTLVWDRLFGTLSPEYERGFGRMVVNESNK
jgi:sterol desaturase/sphingolipid hydroxylase (fatty acid hydroxylase superfamily)